MAGLLKTTAISLAAALSTAASAQILEKWDADVRPQANPSGVQTYAVPDSRYKAPATNPEQRCRDLATSTSLKQFPKAKEAFAQAEDVGCRYVYGLDKNKPLLEEVYLLNNRRGVSSFTKDIEKAERQEERPAAREHHRRERPTPMERTHRRRGESTETTRETRTAPFVPKPVTERRHSGEIVTPGAP